MLNTNLSFQFRPIELPRDERLCVRFREDSYLISFGDVSGFRGPDGHGAEKYLDYLRGKLERDLESAVHVVCGQEVVGQVELGCFRDDSSIGYVNLYYLCSELRGSGYGQLLDQYAVDYFKKRGFRSMRLSVAATNASAIWFYHKMGWLDLGAREDEPALRLMEKLL